MSSLPNGTSVNKVLFQGTIFQKEGKVVYAMDGLLGLPRKKSAAVSYRRALHGHLFFSDQAHVDEFVIQSQHLKASYVRTEFGTCVYIIMD